MTEFDEASCRQVYIMYQNIKRFRIERGMSVKEFADIMGVSMKKLLLVEACADAECLNIINVSRLCDHFGFSIDDIFSEDFFEIINSHF